MESGKRIIVPWDFTEVAQNALAHAVKIAKVLDNTIALLHIAKADKEAGEALPKLQQVAADAEKANNIKVEAVVKVGISADFLSFPDYCTIGTLDLCSHEICVRRERAGRSLGIAGYVDDEIGISFTGNKIPGTEFF